MALSWVGDQEKYCGLGQEKMRDVGRMECDFEGWRNSLFWVGVKIELYELEKFGHVLKKEQDESMDYVYCQVVMEQHI